jgi:hypothetical protein
MAFFLACCRWLWPALAPPTTLLAPHAFAPAIAILAVRQRAIRLAHLHAPLPRLLS